MRGLFVATLFVLNRSIPTSTDSTRIFSLIQYQKFCSNRLGDASGIIIRIEFTMARTKHA